MKSLNTKKPIILNYSNGDVDYYLDGVHHREDGPASEFANGDKEWYYQGKNINCKDNEEF